MLTPTQLSLEQEYAREVEGGVILVGRHSLKGYLEGLRKGWLGERDDESWVAALDDSIFDDPAKPPPSDSASSSQDEPAPAASEPQVSLFPLTHLPASKVPSLATPSVPTTLPPALPPVPSTLPALPPLLLLPYHPELGFSSIPRSIASFFNTRADVQLGGDAAMAFILGQPQTPFAAPSDLEHFEPSLDVRHEQGQGAAGLDFDLEVGEARVPGNFEKTPAQIDERMTTYYEGLKAKVAKAWEIKNGRGQSPSSSPCSVRAAQLTRLLSCTQSSPTPRSRTRLRRSRLCGRIGSRRSGGRGRTGTATASCARAAASPGTSASEIDGRSGILCRDPQTGDLRLSPYLRARREQERH